MKMGGNKLVNVSGFLIPDPETRKDKARGVLSLNKITPLSGFAM